MEVKENYKLAYQKIKNAKKILAIGHCNPDGDSIGSTLAFKHIIEKSCFFKKVDVLCNDKISTNFDFLPGREIIKNKADLSKYDLVVFLDCSDISRAENELYNFDKKSLKNVVNIDHHYTNSNFGDVNIVDSSYSSASALLYDFAKSLDLKVTKQAGICLLTGIYTDTLAFQNTNVLSRTYKIAGEIMDLGVDIQPIIKNFFRNNSVNKLKAWGRILANSFIDGNNVLTGYISHEEMMGYGVEPSDISGVVSVLNECAGVNYSMLVSQNGDKIKGSLRTIREDVDLTEVASQYGGGGHKQASGFTIKGKLKVKTTITID